ncbi:hypothetical protein LTS17_010596 [Exophiala oligosperma]
MLTLDGSTLEGGGQLVRVALSLSSICSIPVRVTNIRANRSSRASRQSSKNSSNKSGSRHDRSGNRRVGGGGGGGHGGGLKESHLAAVNWLAEQCNADVQGNEVGCSEIVFKPSRKTTTVCARSVPTGNQTDTVADVIALQKPGSVWLIWQAIFPCIALRLMDHSLHEPSSRPTKPFRITLKGGTNVPKSPSTEYVRQVLLPLCEKIGLPKVDVNLVQRGWAGSAPEIGHVELTVHRPNTRRSELSHPPPSGHHASRLLEPQHLLAPFTLSSRGPITHVVMTIVSGSSTTQSCLESDLRQALSARSLLSSVPVSVHPSSGLSGDERRLYILLVAHTSDGHRLGRDYLGTGRKVTSDPDRRGVVTEAVARVVRDFTRECESNNAGVDEFAEDQLVIFQALAAGATNVEPARPVRAQGSDLNQHPDRPGSTAVRPRQNNETGSLHTRTVRWVCGQMLGTMFDGHGGCKGMLDL